MSLRTVYLLPILMAAFFSGYFIESSLANRGIIVLSQVIISLFALVYIITTLKYNKKWLILSSILILLLLLNGSSYGSIILVGLNLVLVEIFRKSSRGISLKKTFDFKFLYIGLYLLLIIALMNLFYGSSYLWSNDNKFLPLSRLRLFASEPSHLALLIVPFIFIIKSIKNKISLYTILLLTQSYLGFVFYGLIYFLLRKSNMIILYFISILFIAFILTMDFRDFFINSGLVRLVGISLFSNGNIDLIHLIIGNGLGSGDVMLQPMFDSLGVNQANGFLFSTLYDIGLIGLFLFVYILGKTYFDYFIIFILLLNFGPGNILLVVILFLCQIVYIDYKRTSKIRNKQNT